MTSGRSALTLEGSVGLTRSRRCSKGRGSRDVLRPMSSLTTNGAGACTRARPLGDTPPADAHNDVVNVAGRGRRRLSGPRVLLRKRSPDRPESRGREIRPEEPASSSDRTRRVRRSHTERSAADPRARSTRLVPGRLAPAGTDAVRTSNGRATRKSSAVAISAQHFTARRVDGLLKACRDETS
jgi:hypothetical protein